MSAKTKPKPAPRDLLDEVTPVADEDAGATEAVAVPHPSSPLWTSWVLSQLEDDEAWESEDGRRLPYTKGLRRFVRSLLSVDESVSRVVEVTDLDGQLAVTVEHTIQLASPYDGLPRRVTGVSCRMPANLNDRMVIFPAEVADTVAEGRALTRLLGLTVVTKDEVKGDPAMPLAVQTSARVTPAQVLSLKKLLKVANLGVEGFLKSGRFPLARIEDMPAEVYFRTCKFLAAYHARRQKGEAPADDETLART